MYSYLCHLWLVRPEVCDKLKLIGHFYSISATPIIGWCNIVISAELPM